MGKSLDDVYDLLSQMMITMTRMDERLDQHDIRFEQLEQLMERQESLMKLVEEMGAELIHKVASTNDRLDNLYHEVRQIREEQNEKKVHLDFLEKKVW